MTINGRHIKSESFDDIYEFCDTISSRPLNSVYAVKGSVDNTGSHTCSESFSGTSSFGEADNLMQTGYVKGANALNAIPSIFGDTDKRKTFTSPVGFTPHIPNFVQGRPDSMINATPIRKFSQEITLIYNGTTHAGTSSNDIITNAKKVLDVVNFLEKNNYRVNLYVSFGANEGRDYNYCTIKLKDAKQPLNILKVSYPLCHTSFFRRHFFAWMETTPLIEDNAYLHGYGIPASNADHYKTLGLIKDSDLYLRYFDVDGCHNAEEVIDALNKQLKTPLAKVQQTA